MSVEWECQSIVTDVLCRVVGFRHGTDGDAVNHIFFAASCNLAEEIVIAVGQCLTATNTHLEAQLGDKLYKGVELFRIRFIVNAVDEGLYILICLISSASLTCSTVANALRNIPVGEEHKLFHKPVSLFLFLDIYTYWNIKLDTTPFVFLKSMVK